jgi:hypothetical protein
VAGAGAGWFEADAVVAHGQDNAAVAGVELDPCVGSARVLDRVVQRLLRQPVEMLLLLDGERQTLIGNPD